MSQQQGHILQVRALLARPQDQHREPTESIHLILFPGPGSTDVPVGIRVEFVFVGGMAEVWMENQREYPIPNSVIITLVPAKSGRTTFVQALVQTGTEVQEVKLLRVTTQDSPETLLALLRQNQPEHCEFISIPEEDPLWQTENTPVA